MAEARKGASRDIPGRKREYETIYILRPDTANDAIAGINQKVRGLIESAGGRLLKVQNWGRRKLAYAVQKQVRGVYVFFNYLADAGVSEEVERQLRHSDIVIRYYTVKAAENVDPATRISEVTDASFANASVPTIEEEVTTIGQGGLRPFGEDEEEAGFGFDEAVFGASDNDRA